MIRTLSYKVGSTAEIVGENQIKLSRIERLGVLADVSSFKLA
ncbi:hypothetical protein [Rhizobium sp. RCAM05973]|nr:hypothetical protein [Rhizobium sp. RCAM05973]